MRNGGQQQSGGVGILATMRRRRGSILVLVLGTIALMTVLAVFYAAIGKSDRRAGRAFVTRAATDDVPRQVADYIASILAEDVFSVYPSPERVGDAGNPQWSFRRETWDYPSIDPNVRSAPPAGQRDLLRFRPSGSVPVLPTAPPTAQSVTPVGADPFLASPEPVDLLGEDRSFPGLPNAARESEWIRRLDWPAMSNIAPDGRAVNLFKLREDFDAPPTTQDNGISSGLLQPQANAQTMGTTRPLTGDAADTNRPFDWFTNQVNTARRVDSLDPAWDDPNFLLYQYADASGDGVIDSRWTHLVDATEPTAPSNLITGDPSFRWFVAARIVDLSGRVNVNTAGDFVMAPEVGGSLNAFAGVTPSDVDLLRLLRMEDAYEDTRQPGSAPGSEGLGYRGLPQPQQQGLPGDYSGYTESPSSPGNDVRGRVGTAAYNLLALSRFVGNKPPVDVIGQGDDLSAFFNSDYFGPLLSDARVKDASDIWFVAPQTGEWTQTPLGRVMAYADYGRLVGAGRISSGNPAWSMPALFGISDLSGLLTYEGLNDSSTQTTLESMFDGRSLESDSFGPLRSMRTTRLDRSGEQRDAQLLFASNVRRWITTMSGHRPLRSTVLELSQPGEPTQRDLALRPERDAKVRMPSTVSSMNAARSMFQIYADALMPYASAVGGSWNPGASQQHTLHYGYRGPELALRTAAHMATNLWGGGTLGGPPFVTLLLDGTFQGELNNAIGNPLPNRDFPWAAWTASSPGQTLNAVLNLFDAGEERLAQGANQDITARAVNIYGISPQPFITEVATYYVYADAERDWNDDQDYLRRQDWQGIEPPPPLEQYEITINSNWGSGNRDAVFSFIAIQLHNPFDSSINITQERITPGGAPYYFEIAGRFFDLDGFRMLDSGGGDPTMPELSRSADIKGSEPITIPAGQSRTFVILNETLSEIQGRMQSVEDDSPIPTGVGVIGRFLRQNLASGTSGGRMNLVICEPIQGDPAQPMVNFPGDPGNPQPSAYQQSATFAGFFDLLAGVDGAPMDEVRLWRAKVAEVRDGDGEVIDHSDVPGTTGVNLRANDYLADRFRLPESDRLDAPKLNITDNGTTTVPTTIQGGRIREAWGIFDRQQTTSFQGVPNYNRGATIMSFDVWRRPSDPNSPVGAWPAYCFEDPDGALNIRAERPSGVASIRTGNLAASDFPSPPVRSSTRATTFLTFGDPGSADHQSFLGTVLHDGESIPVAGVEQIDNRFLRASYFRTDASEKNVTGEVIGSTPDGRSASDVRIEFSAGRLGNLRRPADMLLPLAVGASYTPDFSAATLNNENFNDGDRWVTLSEALALSAGYADGLRTGHPAEELYQDAGGVRPQPASTDQLVAGFARPPVFLDRGQLVLDDFVPFVSSAPRTKVADVFGPTRANGDVVFGLGVPMALMIPEMVSAVPGYTGAGEVIPGTINVNTASRAVLRTIPMLSPSRDRYVGSLPQQNSWWWTQIHDSRTDIASTLAAYRDKTRLLPRLDAGVSGNLDDYFVDFTDINEEGFGRLATAQIPGLREARGVRTPGELGALRLRNRENPGQPYTPGDQVQSRNSIDRLAAGNQPITRYGVGSLPQIDGISALAGGYQSELLLANAAMNPTSVRSDYFAVWFLLHGYRRSDVENLSETDPLTPSVARRFVMVVDRSNVVRPGDKPRIVFLREVPIPN
ncbi:MAG: hypothetical protein JJU33_09550 [Phycisphaerales bacterium]|nr:hypothetical protein [Phycisphaerales bacterium]